MRSTRALAWALGLGGAIGSAFALGVTIALGLFSLQGVVLLIFVTCGLLGTLVASREPGNSVGWLMCAGSLVAGLLFLPMDYGYTALVVAGGSWPLGGVALWVNTWSWAPLLGMFVPLITVRFPDGNVPSRWRAVDWLALGGTALFGVSIALAPAEALHGFLPLSQSKASLLAPAIQNPLDTSLPADLLGQVRLVGVAVIVLGYFAAVTALVARFRRARGDERLQLKWFAYSGVLIAVAAVYGVVAWVFRGAALGDALLPLDFAAFTLPLAIGVAILRYRLYDIDLLINRTVVYAAVTAILAAAFAGLDTATQRLVETLSGARSDFISLALGLGLVLGFAPLRRRVQPIVDLLLPGRGLLTLLFTDIVGSTARAIELGDQRWRKLLEAYRATVRHDLARFGGREMDTAGDAFFAIFDHPAQGLRCAVSLLGSLHSIGLDSRFGVHAGECELRGERVSGVNVIVAARVMAEAGANEIVVSEVVRELAAGSEFRFRERGIRPLKGVPGVWRLQSLDVSETL